MVLGLMGLGLVDITALGGFRRCASSNNLIRSYEAPRRWIGSGEDLYRWHAHVVFLCAG